MTEAPDFMRMIDTAAALIAEKDVANERARADKWMESGNKYWDIRDWLRICEDTPEGHAKFYRECSEIIFGPDPDAEAGETP